MVARQVSQTGDWHCLDHPGAVLAGEREAVQGLQAGPHDGVAEVVAEQVQGDHRVDGRRLDAAPAAVVLLPLDDPPARGGHGGPAQGAGGDLAVRVQGAVQPLEGAVPARQGGEAGAGRRIGRVGVQLVQGERGGAHRALGGDDGERNDGLPGPAAEVVDVQRGPRRQEDQLGRQLGEPVPGPPAEEGEPDPGEDPGLGDAALGADPVGGAGHVRGVGAVPGEPQRDVRLDGGGEVGRAAVEGGPGAVLALFAADEEGGGAGGGLVTDAEELAEQQVLGVHRDVGVEVPLPPALGALEAQEVVGGAGPGPLRGGLDGGPVEGGGVGGGRGGTGRGGAGGRGPGRSVGRRCHGVPLVQWSVCVCSGVCRRPAPDQGAGRRQRVICGGGCSYCR